MDISPINVSVSLLLLDKLSTNANFFMAREDLAVLNTRISGNRPDFCLQSEVTSLLIRMINLYEKAGKQDTAAHSDIFNL